MAEETALAKSQRLLSLDAFRGITIAGMILVNNPGSWSHIYPPLEHATWHGWTPTDFIFPFFLFIVGVAMTFSFDRRLSRGDSRTELFVHVVRRSAVLFLLGLILAGFPRTKIVYNLVRLALLIGVGAALLALCDSLLARGFIRSRISLEVIKTLVMLLFLCLVLSKYSLETMRIPGVLQRIAVCYFFASIIVMNTGWKGRLFWAIFFIAIYWDIVAFIPAPAGFTPTGKNIIFGGKEGLLGDFIDTKILGIAHLYRERPDPEGILSTLPAISTTLLGVLIGNWLHTSRSHLEKVVGMFVMGITCIVIGDIMSIWFPINKKIWTSSYVVFMTGMALQFLAMCYWLMDVKGYKKWASPFLVYGTNAIAVFFASGIMGRVLYSITWAQPNGKTIDLKTYIYNNAFASWAGPLNGSLAFAISYIILWLLILVPLYRTKTFIKI
jgi:predicted acyltransferase